MAVQSPDPDPSGSSGEPAIPSAAPGFLTVELTAAHDVADFQCSRDPDAVAYLQNGVWRFLEHSCGQAFVYMSKARPGCVDGYYHLVGSSLTRGDAQNTDQKRMPVGAPVPVFVIAYVARDDRAQRGLGSALVVDAARRARTLYPTWGLMLFARNARLVKFYEELGFKVIRSLKREREAAEGLKGEGPFQMYAPHEALIIE